MTKIFQISATNNEKFLNTMNKMTRKASKLNLPFGYTLESESMKQINDTFEKVYNYSVYGESPVINGYTFLAKIEKLNDANLIHSHNTSFDFTSYRDCNLICEHCNVNRFRNFYYLIIDESNNVKMVGHNCLANYIEQNNAEQIAEFYSSIFELNDNDEDEESTGEKFSHGKNYLSIESFLAYAVKSVNQFGYKKSDDLHSTKQDTLINYFDKEVKTTEDEQNEAKKILNFVYESLNTKTQYNEYEMNILKLIENKLMTYSHAGYIVSIIPMYNKMIEKQIIKNSQPESNHLGTIDGKINDISCTVTRYNKIENKFNGMTHIYNFIDNAGNVLTWFSSKDLDLNISDKILITVATVKKHDTFNGIKQTIINRAKFTI